MTIDEFWDVVERVHVASGGDMTRKCELLGKELRKLPPPDVKSFDNYLGDLYRAAYNWDLWAAAYIIAEGCGDDSFMDFRFTLVSMGRRAYERALADADSLADVEFTHADYEGYQYVPPTVYEELMKGQGASEQQLAKERDEDFQSMPEHPKEPSGTPFEMWDMEARLPKVTVRYGHKDSDHLIDRDRINEEKRNKARAAELSGLLLDSGIIPACGLVPPYRVVAKVLRTGRAPAVTGREYVWEPFELIDGDYWRTLEHLGQLKPEQLKHWPQLRSKEVRLDRTKTLSEDYDVWLESVKKREMGD